MARVVTPTKRDEIAGTQKAAPKIKDIAPPEPSESDLIKTTIRLHAKVKDAILRYTKSQGRVEADVYRDLIMEGLRAKGVEINWESH